MSASLPIFKSVANVLPLTVALIFDIAAPSPNNFPNEPVDVDEPLTFPPYCKAVIVS